MGEVATVVIDGSPVEGAAGTYPVHNPVRPAEVVLHAPACDTDQLERAVAAARRAHPAWAATGFEAREATVLRAAEAAGRAVADLDLARLLTREHGKVLWEAEFDAGTVAAMAGAFADLARPAGAPRRLDEGRPSVVRRLPHGVVAAVLPYNWPVSVLGTKVLPALLMGNTVVAKVPPTCPGAVLAVATVLAGALPAGVLNTICGPDADLGRRLVGHRGVDMVSFTGSVATGRAVAAAAAGNLAALVLELGGNDPAIVAPDVPIDRSLADRIVDAAFLTAGQVCVAVKRVYVPEDRVPAMVEALGARLSAECVGDGLAEGVTMGPVHRADDRRRVEDMLTEATLRGATVRRFGELRPEDAGAGGHLVRPAVVVGAPDDTRIVADEQFGPALPVCGYRTLDEAFDRANDSTFGLCASIWTHDEQVAQRAADRLQAGTVFVNAHGTVAMDPRAPFGGWKQSGFGVELGPEGLAAFGRPKTVLHHGGTDRATLP